MKSIEVDNTVTGWTAIPPKTEKIVAHFKDGHTETISLVEYITMHKRKKNLVIRIDCYSASEELPKE